MFLQDFDAHVNFTTFTADNPEKADRIWVPNFELYNSAESISADTNTIREVVYGARKHINTHATFVYRLRKALFRRRKALSAAAAAAARRPPPQRLPLTV
jgi:hypothetical protein